MDEPVVGVALPAPDLSLSPERLGIHLLGGFRVSVGERLVEAAAWRLRKAQSLLKLLALAPEHRLHREQVMELLWPDLEPEAAGNNLRRTLHALRRTLAPPPAPATLYVCSEGDVLVLRSDRVWIDVQVFESAAAVARRTGALADYRESLGLYGGDLLPEDPYEDWAASRREQLRAIYLELLGELAELHEAHGELLPAVEALRRVVACEPLHEAAHLGLMRLYALAGQRHHALRQYGELERVLRRELDVEPSPESQRLYRDILEGRLQERGSGRNPPSPLLAPSPAPENRHNLPAPLTVCIGREQEIAAVEGLLRAARLVTLVGVGGSGKTRLALEVAARMIQDYPDGVWLVDLTALADPTLVPQAIASAVGVREEQGRPLTAALVDALRTRHLLLVLDNCEHLLEGCAAAAQALLQACPELRMLATSRQTLGMGGEAVWRVPPLPVPDPRQPLPQADRLIQWASIRLFVERARFARPEFTLTPENAGTVASICAQLDGLPLAIELAAARIAALVPDQISARLADRFRLLTSSSPTISPRHRTLQGTVDWSYDLLAAPERALLKRLSVFAAGWSLEAAEAVARDVGIDVLEGVTALVDKSWVLVGVERDGAVRYRMVETLRHYARERLAESQEAETAQGAYVDYYLELAERAETALLGSEQADWLERLEREHDNLRAALQAALKSGTAEQGLRLAGALGRFWELRGYLSEGQRWLEEALARGEGAPLLARSKALNGAGNLAARRGDLGRAEALFRQGLALRKELGDKRGIAIALNNLGLVAQEQGDYPRAADYHRQSLALKRELGDRRGIAITLNNFGLVARDQRDHRLACSLHQESLVLFQDLGDKWGIALALSNLGRVARDQGDYTTAGRHLRRGLVLRRELGDRWCIACSLDDLARLAVCETDHERAVRLFGAAEALRRTLGAALPPAERADYERCLGEARAALDQRAFEAAWAEGEAMSLDDCVAYALEDSSPLPPVGAMRD